MTMQSYDLKLTAAKSTIEFNAAADGFWYESETGGIATDKRIIVRPDNGNEIILKPGQSFRIPQMVNTWYVRSLDGASVITGKIIIGSGEFSDTNVKLDGSIAIAGTPTVNLSAGTKVQEELIAYTGSYSSNAAMTANTAIQIVAPGTNLNGIIVNKVMLENHASVPTLIAKAGAAPANYFDGDVLCIASTNVNESGAFTRDTTRLKVPAGKGLYLITNTNGGPRCSVNYTVL